MKPWETDAFSIMQGFFFPLKTCLFPPQGKGLNHSVKEKSYFTVFFFLMVISSNLRSFMSLSSMLLREAELEQIQTFLSHSQISCNWKCQGDKGRYHVRIHCSGWKDLTLLVILKVPVLFIGGTLRLDKNMTYWKLMTPQEKCQASIIFKQSLFTVRT